LGIDEMGCKTILGFHQGASEGQTACDGLFSTPAARGLNFGQSHLNIIDDGKALRAGVRRYGGESSPILRFSFTSVATSLAIPGSHTDRCSIRFFFRPGRRIP